MDKHVTGHGRPVDTVEKRPLDHRTSGDLAIEAGDLSAEEAAEAARRCGLNNTLGGLLDGLAHLGTADVGRDLGTGGIGTSHVWPPKHRKDEHS